MLVLTRRPGESVILTYPTELDLEPITITILEDGKTGIDAQQQVQILRSELVEMSLQDAER